MWPSQKECSRSGSSWSQAEGLQIGVIRYTIPKMVYSIVKCKIIDLSYILSEVASIIFSSILVKYYPSETSTSQGPFQNLPSQTLERPAQTKHTKKSIFSPEKEDEGKRKHMGSGGILMALCSENGQVVGLKMQKAAIFCRVAIHLSLKF